jgi:hypothetical protein
MQFTDEVNWDVADFFLAAALRVGVGVPYELVVRKTGDTEYRAGAGLALAALLDVQAQSDLLERATLLPTVWHPIAGSQNSK